MEDQHRNDQPWGQRGAQSNHATIIAATITTTSTRVAYPFTVQAPPAKDIPKPSHMPWQLYMIMAIVILIFAGYTIYFGIHNKPRPPKFQVDSISISPFNVWASHVTLSWNVNFNVENPIKGVIIEYEKAEVSIFLKEVNLLSTIIVPFEQIWENERSRKTTVITRTVTMTLTNHVVNDILWNMSHGVVNFILTIDGALKLNLERFYRTPLKMRVTSEDVTIVFPDSTTTGARPLKMRVTCEDVTVVFPDSTT